MIRPTAPLPPADPAAVQRLLDALDGASAAQGIAALVTATSYVLSAHVVPGAREAFVRNLADRFLGEATLITLPPQGQS